MIYAGCRVESESWLKMEFVSALPWDMKDVVPWEAKAILQTLEVWRTRNADGGAASFRTLSARRLSYKRLIALWLRCDVDDGTSKQI